MTKVTYVPHGENIERYIVSQSDIEERFTDLPLVTINAPTSDPEMQELMGYLTTAGKAIAEELMGRDFKNHKIEWVELEGESFTVCKGFGGLFYELRTTTIRSALEKALSSEIQFVNPAIAMARAYA